MPDMRTRQAVDEPGAPVVRSLPSSEEVLLEQVGTGDGDAFAELYDRTTPAVYGMARRVVVDASLAEEVTQEVLLEVWSKAASFDRTRGSARSWILTMAHRRAVDVVRREQASSNRVDRVAAASSARPYDEVAEAVLERLESDLRALAVDRALGTLTALQRSALELAYFKGFTYREVAQILEVPVGTAKSRIRDGLRRLADQLLLKASPGGLDSRVW